ncbi:methyltransferase domain-containing protein [uncultured Phenylobacterium sp.]|uniref:class I SAM-dependent methyltransferase n=1 Tax=uncultured Phenylobacterium sp. TaxID=349273 RepID=UPI0025E63503|nr:methyltransferase domain-containing protein [uncultured Phenylobacterium sp.]
MDRAEFLTLIDVANQRGLEIGALNQPVVTRAMGPVEYVDRATRDELIEWYKNPLHGIDPADIVPVDHIWGERSLLECVGGQRAYDYVVASHVIEHVPDLFGWLGEIAGVLVDGGLALFMVPDKRFTFDRDRLPSVSGDFVDAYLRRLRRPDTRQIFNHYNDTRPADVGPRGEEELTALAQGALALCRQAETNGEYIDAHAWVFTPRSLAQALDLGSRLDLLPFEIALLAPTAPGSGECLLALRRLPDAMQPGERRAAFTSSLAALELPEELELLAAEGAAAVARLKAIEASTSWRLTAPLRRMVELVRQRRTQAP